MQTSKTHGVAMITGASSGLGAVFADRLAGRGHDLVLIARDEGRLSDLAERLRAQTGQKVDVLAADLTCSKHLAMVEARLASDVDISIFVNNAGMALSTGLLEAETSQVEQLIALNVVAATRLAIAAGRGFKTRGSGKIVNIGSVAALMPESSGATYSAS
jgi:short-subunit dehydrogenase